MPRACPPQTDERADSGVVLINSSLQALAADKGALAILARHDHGAAPGPNGARQLPDEIVQAVRNWRSAGVPLPVLSIRAGERSYRCRLYPIVSDHPSLAPAIVAAHLEIGSNGADPIRRLAADHHLTEREEEALHGIALGLSTKELADRMAISPNTVKSFVRLIMIKLGVTSRAAIMVKLLESTPGGSAPCQTGEA